MNEVQERMIAIGRAKEIVGQLRRNDWELQPVDAVYQACEDGANEIERLERRVAELEERLDKQRQFDKQRPNDSGLRSLIPHWY